uniref:Metalloendopeptidase n=1 Tax=Parastrongyloides trichosuri TaxID=131310 RepID=A0A0N4Z3G8_PARTI
MFCNIFSFSILATLVSLIIGEKYANEAEILKRDRRAILIKRKFNYTLPIPIYFNFGSPQKYINRALKDLSKYTCIEFEKQKREFEGPGIVFESSDCNEIEYGIDHGEPTNILLDYNCLRNVGCVKHYVGLALGLIPHQNRWDRNDYVRIFYNMISTENKKEYDKVRGTDVRIFNTAFDFGSLMNYEATYLSPVKEKVFVSKWHNLYNDMLGQRDDYTHNDIKLLNDWYCGNKCTPKVKGCKNGGYPDPLVCGQCRCPRGYAGKQCTLVDRRKVCGQQYFRASNKFQTITLDKNGTCSYKITSQPRTKIQIIVEKANTKQVRPCIPKDGLEIKNRYDKGATGLSLCGSYDKPVKMKPIFSEAMVIFSKRRPEDIAVIKFKAVSAQEAAKFDYDDNYYYKN